MSARDQGRKMDIRTILVVEDSRTDQLVVRSTLAKLSPPPEIVFAASISEAKALLDARSFDVALVDWQLPDGLGYAVLQHALNGGSGVPVVMMTGGESGVVEDTLGQGAQDFVTKPIKDEVVVARALRYAVNRSQWAAERREQSLLSDATERYDAMSRLAAGIAHDLNNTLAVISMNLELLASTIPLHNPDVVECLDAAREATLAAGARCNQLRTFTGNLEVESRRVDMVERLRAAALQHQMAEPPDISGLAGRPANVRGDSDLLDTLVSRLLSGAAELGEVQQVAVAMTDARAEIRGDARSAWIHPPEPNAELPIRITLPWEGVERTPLVIRRRFEPFGEGAHGASLDLGECIGFIRAHGGALAVRTHSHGGAFELRLPSWAAPTKPSPVVEPQARPAGGRVVWVVDDEPMVRRILVRLLRRRGFDVKDFPDGHDAYMAVMNGDSFDILVTDLLMPGMGGADLVRRLRADGFSQPVVVVTGYSADVPTLSELGGITILLKPFTNASLYEAVDGGLHQLGDRA